MKRIIILFIFSFCIGLISADIYSDESIYGTQKEVTTTTSSITNYYNSTNNTDEWDTNIGSLDDVNDTQFDNNGGTLTLDISWLLDYINSWFGTKSTDDLTEGSTNLYDNQSWNQNLADTLYADINFSGGSLDYNYFTFDIKSSKYNNIVWDISDAEAEYVNVKPEGEIEYVFGKYIGDSKDFGESIWSEDGDTAIYRGSINVTGQASINKSNIYENGGLLVIEA